MRDRRVLAENKAPAASALPERDPGLPSDRKSNTPKKGKTAANWFLREPHWLVRDGLLALVIGASLLGLQVRMDERLSDRELAIEDARAKQAERLENLRYVRERAGDPKNSDGQTLKSFENLDLTGMNLSGLYLPQALFWRASLDRADFTSAHLEGASFGSTSEKIEEGGSADGTAFKSARLERAMFHNWDGDRADLSGAILIDAEFIGGSYALTNFTRAVMHNVLLQGVDLSQASGLESAYLSGGCYKDVKWPSGFKPPDGTGETC